MRPQRRPSDKTFHVNSTDIIDPTFRGHKLSCLSLIMSDTKHKDFKGALPSAGVLRKRGSSFFFEEEIPITLGDAFDPFEQGPTPTLRDMGFQGDFLLLLTLLEPYKELVEKHLEGRKDETPILWDKKEVILTVGDVKRLAFAYYRVLSLGQSLAALEELGNSGTDPLFRKIPTKKEKR